MTSGLTRERDHLSLHACMPARSNISSAYSVKHLILPSTVRESMGMGSGTGVDMAVALRATGITTTPSMPTLC